MGYYLSVKLFIISILDYNGTVKIDTEYGEKFQSLSLFEFQQRFPDDQSCMEYLVATKWSDGFICEQCSHQKYCNGKPKTDQTVCLMWLSGYPNKWYAAHRERGQGLAGCTPEWLIKQVKRPSTPFSKTT